MASVPAQGENNFLTHFSSLIILDCVPAKKPTLAIRAVYFVPPNSLFGANYLFDGHVIGMFIFP
ncbi:hypothetical protein O5833_29645, partial [Escherichia coli]|nr:hypothetical protein [Escherichia coli]